MNTVSLLGNIATEIRLQQSKDGNTWASFNLGYTRVRGQNKQSCFIGVVAFGALAENLSKYCFKGRQVAVSGELESINDKLADGSYRQQCRIIANSIDFLGDGGKR